MPPSDSQTVVLPDGRTLGYAAYGTPSGTPLLYFHGFPSCRLEAYGLQAIAARHNVRLLALDRPGFGLSTDDPQRRFTDWAADVQAFAAELDLSRFAILGASGGGPFALACAQQLPPGKMLTAVGVLAGAPVWDRGFRTEGVPWYARGLYLAANYWPAALRVVIAALVSTLRWLAGTRFVERRLDAALEGLEKKEVGVAEQQQQQRKEKNDGDTAEEAALNPQTQPPLELPQESIPEKRTRLLRLFFESLPPKSESAAAAAGFLREAYLLGLSQWGFRVEEIPPNLPIRMWHGALDANAPVRSARDLAERIERGRVGEKKKEEEMEGGQDSILKVWEDDDHFGAGRHFEEVIKELVDLSSRSEAEGETEGQER